MPLSLHFPDVVCCDKPPNRKPPDKSNLGNEGFVRAHWEGMAAGVGGGSVGCIHRQEAESKEEEREGEGG